MHLKSPVLFKLHKKHLNTHLSGIFKEVKIRFTPVTQDSGKTNADLVKLNDQRGSMMVI